MESPLPLGKRVRACPERSEGVRGYTKIFTTFVLVHGLKVIGLKPKANSKS